VDPRFTRLAMDGRRLRNPLTIAGLATAYYFLTSLALERIPFVWLPAWWPGIWPTQKVGVYVWFGLLNGAAAMLAALPIALLLAWLFARPRQTHMAFYVGVIAGLGTVISVFASDYSHLGRPPAIALPVSLMTLAEFLELLMAVPLFVWIIGAFVSYSSLDRSRA